MDIQKKKELAELNEKYEKLTIRFNELISKKRSDIITQISSTFITFFTNHKYVIENNQNAQVISAQLGNKTISLDYSSETPLLSCIFSIELTSDKKYLIRIVMRDGEKPFNDYKFIDKPINLTEDQIITGKIEQVRKNIDITNDAIKNFNEFSFYFELANGQNSQTTNDFANILKAVI